MACTFTYPEEIGNPYDIPHIDLLEEQQKQMMEANQTKQTKEGQNVYKGDIPTLSVGQR